MLDPEGAKADEIAEAEEQKKKDKKKKPKIVVLGPLDQRISETFY